MPVAVAIRSALSSVLPYSKRMAWKMRTCLAIRWLVFKIKYKMHRTPQASAVIVSLTSYPARFTTLHLTLQSLLAQSIRPEKTVLWVSPSVKDLLPNNVTSLKVYGLSIEYCTDIGSYTKLIPALKTYGDHTIVTADDDIYYKADWLETLLKARNDTLPQEKEILCHRMHKIKLSSDGLPLPYNDWGYENQDISSSTLHFPTGVGGVLYPPGIFTAEVFNEKSFLSICRSADDVWFYWMARLNGATFRRVPSSHRLYCWPGTDDTGLAKINVVQGHNDKQIQAMISQYGFFND